jgi:hypothetical protein
MNVPSNIETVDDLPEELRNQLGDLAPGVFLQILALSVGPLGKALGAFLPNQRLDRVALFAARLRQEWTAMSVRLNELEEEIRDGRAPERARLFLDGATAAINATSSKRASQLARIVAHGISGDEVVAQKARTLLSSLEELTDIEFMVLLYFHRHPDREYFQTTRRPISEQISHEPTLAKIFEGDVAFWVACVTKLEARGLLRKSTTWGGELGDSEWDSERLEAAEYSPKNFSITSLGRLLASNVGSIE